MFTELSENESSSFYRGPDGIADYYTEFQLPLDKVQPGDVACISSELILYEDSATAAKNFRRVHDQYVQVGWEELPALNFGDQTSTLHHSEVVAYGCSDCCEDVSGETYFVLIQDENVVAMVEQWTFEGGGDLQPTLDLAREQAKRMDMVISERQ